MVTIHQVKIAEIKIAETPAVLSCVGLGSCVAVALYDASKQIGGLAHIVLATSRGAKNSENIAKFADTAIIAMVKTLERRGATRKNITAKIFGGANMFPTLTSRTLLAIGERNISAVCAELQKLAIPITAQDVGGQSGRTIYFDLATGSVSVKGAKGAKERIF